MPQSQEANLLRHLRKLVNTRGPGQQSDRQLLQRYLADADENAFAALVERHGAMVLGVCRSVLLHQQDAEDALQATFLVLARRASTIRKQQSLASWLHGVAYRLALKAKSRRRVQSKSDVAPMAPEAKDDLTVRELQAILHEELQALPEKYRTPILLCYWEGKTRDEAADQLGWARGTFKEQLERARNLLRGRLTRRGLVPSAALFTALLTETAAQAIIPHALIETTAKAAIAFAAGKSASGSAAILAEGVIRTMQITKWASTALLCILLGTFGAGIGYFAFGQGDSDAQPVLQPVLNKDDKKADAKKPDAKDADELADLEGKWKLQAAGIYGAVTDVSDKHFAHFRNKLVRLNISEFDRNFEVKLDRSQKPATIRLEPTGLRSKDDQVAHGIFKVEGDKLTLILKMYPIDAEPKKLAPPKDFIGKPQDVIHLVFTREKDKPEPKQPEPKKEAAAELEGKWHLQSAEIDGREQDQINKQYALFEGDTAFLNGTGFDGNFRFVLIPTWKPKGFRLEPTGGQRNLAHGIYKIEGDTLTMCLFSYDVGAEPKVFLPPADFKPKAAKYMLFVFTREKDKKPEAKQPEAKKELPRELEGKWHLESSLIDGLESEQISKQVAIFEGESVLLNNIGFDGNFRFELNQTLNPKTIRLQPTSGQKKLAHGIYKIEGDTLTMCLFAYEVNAEPKVFLPPADFKAKAGNMLFVFTRDQFPKPAPDVEWNGHNKGLPRSQLKVEVTPGEKIARTKLGLSMPVKIRNESKETIVVKLPHEWHGGEWATTDLYASALKQVKFGPDVVVPLRPAYQIGERGGKETAPITLAPGKAIDVNVRMDWPGTGSVKTFPLIDPADHGNFYVSLLLVFEVDKQKQFVVSEEKTVELVAEEKLPAVKDADADAWLKANVDGFLLTLSRNGGAGGAVRLATNSLPEDGPRDPLFLITKKEAAAITQALVDTGLWGRADTPPKGPLPQGYYLHVGPKGIDTFFPGPPTYWMWRLGTLDDDIASRVIVQHLLKLGGDREKAIREWLDSRPKAKAPAPGPKQLTFVRRIDLGGFKPKVLGAVDKPVVMINANELAQTFPKALADQFARQVDFSKERLVLFTWGGPAADKFDYRVQDGEKVTEVIFDFTPSINGDFAIHAHLFAVSYEATMRIGPPRPLVVPQVRKIEEQPERVIWANKAFGPPVEITRAEDFDKAIPDAGWRLRNEAWKQQVLKKVDFKRERLVLFAWTGAGGESLDYRLLDRDIAPLVIFRNYVEHKGETKGHHFYLYAVAKDARLLLNSSGVVEQPAAKPPIREIDMRGLKLDKAQGDVTKPVKIANEEELVGTFLLFADKAWPGKILPQVDFKNEYVLLFTWGGSGGDQLTFRVNSIGTDDGREVEFRYMGGPDPDHRPHVRVFVLPRGATWKVTGVR